MDYENNEITTISDTDNDFVQNNDNEINESTSTVAYEVFDEITTVKINEEMVDSDFEEENIENALEVTTMQPDIEIETIEEQLEITTESIKGIII